MYRMTRCATACGLALWLAMSGGCSLFAPHTQTLTINPTVADAEVYVNGNYVGQGTVSTTVRRGESHAIMARAGDRVATARTYRRLSGTGVADVIGGVIFLVPFLGALSPGFWDVDPAYIDLVIPLAPAAQTTP